jgi:hypothetical protein
MEEKMIEIGKKYKLSSKLYNNIVTIKSLYGTIARNSDEKTYLAEFEHNNEEIVVWAAGLEEIETEKTLIVKVSHYEIPLDENDRIMYNGACYQIYTRFNYKGNWLGLAKSRAEKLIKEGKLVSLGKTKIHGTEVELFKIGVV